MGSNHLQVTQGFRILLTVFAPYIARELTNEYGQNWWEEGVLNRLYEEQKRNLPISGPWDKLVDSLDIQRCLLLFDLHWGTVFRKKLSIDHRIWAKELMRIRNRLAHLGGEDFSDSDTWRALDTMSRLCEQIDAESAEEIRSLMRFVKYGSANGSTSVESVPTPSTKTKQYGVLHETPVQGLSCWREVIEPHSDVAQGRYKNAEFAANLSQVVKGEGADEYRDPVEFFARTYVTEGMANLLEQALRRVCGKDGEPVIQLKTAFGGGKTHSMIALYHLLGGRVSLEKIPKVEPVLEKAGVRSLPRANIAVLVGTVLDPTKSRRPANMPGITINTLWGEMAAQLALSAGNLKLYDYVREADRKGVSPGSEALKELFDACGPCLILMDELVAYARRLYGASGLPAGTFENFLSFIQEITEAAYASKNSLVVASIPESDIEVGGEAGQIALATIEHTFGRMESIWKPVAANEGFEIVRRRLFLDCKNPEARDEVCRSFSQMYYANRNDFPFACSKVAYRERMIACYPIHPEVFDRLYEDWATLEKFQRTRGVLRLMAAVIHELWMSRDMGLMIMPGSIPLDAPSVRDELTRHLSEGWNALVDREVDGRNSTPFQKDQENPRFGKNLAARRVARTIMLGSAPTVRQQNVRGIEASRIRLGVVQPGENIANFNDALDTLQRSLAYLYTSPNGERFWYDTRPTLRKTVEDRATQISLAEVDYEIEQRLKELKKAPPFAALHVCPKSTLDVTDEQAARLVILPPSDTYTAKLPENQAFIAAMDILNNRGTSPRMYRNMLAFVAPDLNDMETLRQEVRYYLAWKRINEESELLGLDTSQIKETEINLKSCSNKVEKSIQNTYCWLLVPYIDRNEDIREIQWDVVKISGMDEGIVTRAAKKMMQNEALITEWAPALLKMELDHVLWRESNHLSVKQLWDYLCTYCYLPRLANENVLQETIRAGVNATEYFAYASGFDGTRYLDLKFNQYVGIIERSGYLVKLDAAQKQLEEDFRQKQAEIDTNLQKQAVLAQNVETSTDFTPSIGNVAPVFMNLPEEPEAPKNRHFYMSAQLDTTRIGRDVQKLVEEVISHLISVDNAQVELSLEVNVKAPEGISQQVVRTVSENCRTLKVRSFGFDN